LFRKWCGHPLAGVVRRAGEERKEGFERMERSIDHIILFDFHQQVDGLQEQENTQEGQSLGTTKKGIGPTYSSKVTRNGIRIGELLGDFSQFSEKCVFICSFRLLLPIHYEDFRFQGLVTMYQRMFPSLTVDVESELAKYKSYAERVRPLVRDTVSYLDKAIKTGKRVLVEEVCKYV
jgi:adenylosuccinate synthase